MDIAHCTIAASSYSIPGSGADTQGALIECQVIARHSNDDRQSILACPVIDQSRRIVCSKAVFDTGRQKLWLTAGYLNFCDAVGKVRVATLNGMSRASRNPYVRNFS